MTAASGVSGSWSLSKPAPSHDSSGNWTMVCSPLKLPAGFGLVRPRVSASIVGGGPLGTVVVVEGDAGGSGSTDVAVATCIRLVSLLRPNR